MSPNRNRAAQNELYICQEAGRTSSTTTTRVYFTEMLDAQTLNQSIRPVVIELAPRRANIESVVGYPHYLAIRWLHVDVILGSAAMHELENDIKEVIDIAVTDAFGWTASVIKELKNFSDVIRKSTELKVNWSRGQMPL